VYETFDGRNSTAHFYAAGAMFGCFAVVALANGWKDGATAGYRHVYRSIGGAMAFAAALFAVYRIGIEAWGWGAWGKEVFWLEVVEIALFGLFWIAQTIQLWPEPETM
jgi:type IV secretory pathway VirB2 component (pilin)